MIPDMIHTPYIAPRISVTIVFWDDGDKTVVKCQPGDTFSAEAGLTAAMLKKYMGNDNTFNKVINEWLARASYASVPALPEATE